MDARTRIIVTAGMAMALGMGFSWLSGSKSDREIAPTRPKRDTVRSEEPNAPIQSVVVPATVSKPRLSRAPQAPTDHGVDAAGLQMDPGVRRQTYVRVDVPLSLLAEPRSEAGPLKGFTLPVFDGRELEIEITRHETLGSGSGSFVGQVAGKPGSFVVLGYDGEAEAGTVQIPQEGYILSISYAGNGLLRLSELDPKAMPGCGEPLTPDTPAASAKL